MKVLVVGGSGATGRLLVKMLLERDINVRVIIRENAKLPVAISDHPDLSITLANLLNLDDSVLADHTNGCEAIISCLGHTMSWRGIFGKPHHLVTEAVRRLCHAVAKNAPGQPVKFLLMNTAGYRNPDDDPSVDFKHRCVNSLLRVAIPPHRDNENAANYLRTLDSGSRVQWVVVRPDSLIDAATVSNYSVHVSPLRDAFFNAGKNQSYQCCPLYCRTDYRCGKIQTVGGENAGCL